MTEMLPQNCKTIKKSLKYNGRQGKRREVNGVDHPKHSAIPYKIQILYGVEAEKKKRRLQIVFVVSNSNILDVNSPVLRFFVNLHIVLCVKSV